MRTADSKTCSSLDSESLRAIGNELEKHFPQPSEETELVMMEISPHRLHVYWHITPWDLDSVSARAKDAKASLVIRFHELSDAAGKQSNPASFDLEIAEPSGSQYVELWEDAKCYAAKLGLVTSEGRLLELARSNSVELPRAGHAPSSGTQVLTLTPLADQFFAPPTEINQASPSAAKQGSLWQENTNQPLDSTLSSNESPLLPVFPDPVRDSSKDLHLEMPVFPRIDAIAIAENGVSEIVAREENSPLSLTDTVKPAESARIADEFPLFQVDKIDGLETDGFTPQVQLISIEKATRIPTASPLPPWPDRLPRYRPAHATTTSPIATILPGSFPQPLSSFNLGATGDAEVHMELHICGRKQPNGQFILHGQPIPTGEDGTFSLIRILPPETQQLVAQLLAASRED